MSTKKQYEDSARNVAIGLVALFIICIFLLLGKCSKAQTTGYLVTVATVKKAELLKTTSAAAADSLINLHICKFTGVENALENTPFFELRTKNATIYCEKKQVKSVKLKYRKTR